MKTIFILLAQYDGLAVVPVELVCRDYFRHLTVKKFLHKVTAGEINLTVVRMEGSHKAAKGVHINDLAAYVDKMRATAHSDHVKLHGTPYGMNEGPTAVEKVQ